MNSKSLLTSLPQWLRLTGLALATLVGVGVAQAGDFEDPQRIVEVAEQHATGEAGDGRVRARAQIPDSRLRLARCPTRPQATSTGRGSRLQVQVSCPGQWRIYVPVSLDQDKQLVVAARSLQTQEVISADDLSLEWQSVTHSGYGHFESPEALIGRRVAAPIQAGQIITPAQVRQAVSINKGDVVTLLSRIGGVEIRGRGRAEHDAVENTRVRVRNLDSGRIVEGYARDGRIVEIQG